MSWDMYDSDAADMQYERAKALRSKTKPLPVSVEPPVIEGMDDSWGEPPKYLRKEGK